MQYRIPSFMFLGIAEIHFDHEGGIREAACYDSIEDCDYYKLQLDEVASCKQQNDCVSCTSQKHCGFERGRCTFIGEDWWLKKSMIQTPGECQDCIDCVQKGNSFNFEGKCSEKCDGDVNCYETQHDCEQWSAVNFLIVKCTIFDLITIH